MIFLDTPNGWEFKEYLQNFEQYSLEFAGLHAEWRNEKPPKLVTRAKMKKLVF